MKLEEIPSACIHNMENSKVAERSGHLQTSSDDQELIDYLLRTIQDIYNQLQNKGGSKVSRGENKNHQFDLLCLQIHLSRSEAARRSLEREVHCLRTILNTHTSKHRENIAYLEQQVKFEQDQARKERESAQRKVKELEEELNAVRHMLQHECDKSGLGGRVSYDSYMYSPAEETACRVHTQCSNRWNNQFHGIYRTSVHFDCTDHLRGAYLARGSRQPSEDYDVTQDGAGAHEAKSTLLVNPEDKLSWRGLNSKDERTLQPYKNGVIERQSKSIDYKANIKLPNTSQTVIESPEFSSLSSDDSITDSFSIVRRKPSSTFTYNNNNTIHSPNIKANVVYPDNKTWQTLDYNIMKPAPSTPANYFSSVQSKLLLASHKSKSRWSNSNYEGRLSYSSQESLPASETGEIVSLANGKEASGPANYGQSTKDGMDTQTKVNINCIGCGKVFLPNEHLLFLDHFEVCQKS